MLPLQQPPGPRFHSFHVQSLEGKQWLIYNHEAFSGDIFLWYELNRLCLKHRIETIIETGTGDGSSTQAFAEMAPAVESVEIDPSSYQAAQKRLQDLPHVHLHLGDTLAFLPQALVCARLPLLIFLDAHAPDKHIPLVEELELVAQARLRPVIAIHDFKNPQRPEFRWDTYDQTGEYRWELVAPAIEKIYGDRYCAYYNDMSAGARVGVLFVEPT